MLTSGLPEQRLNKQTAASAELGQLQPSPIPPLSQPKPENTERSNTADVFFHFWQFSQWLCNLAKVWVCSFGKAHRRGCSSYGLCRVYLTLLSNLHSPTALPKESDRPAACCSHSLLSQERQGLTAQQNDPLLADSDKKAPLRPQESVSNKAIR